MMNKIDINKYTIFKRKDSYQVVGIETLALNSVREKCKYNLAEIKIQIVNCVYLKHEHTTGIDSYRFIDEYPNEICLGELSENPILIGGSINK